MQIGFTGLGHMGNPMACNLLQAGHSVKVFDLNPTACEHLEKQGAQIATHSGDTAKDSDIVFTMLQTGEQVASCCLGDNGIFAHMNQNNALYIDCSSIDIAQSRQLHHRAESNNIAMLDAPVSGGVAAAQAASLTFMVGGSAENFAKAKQVLSQLGKAVIHAGDSGNGVAAKICNNMILGISMIAVSEGFCLAEKLGLTAEKLFDICSQATAQCWSMTSYCPAPGILDNVPSSNEYQPGFAAEMMLKDLNLSQKAAQSVHTNVSLGQHATELYRQFNEDGNAELDFSAIIRWLATQK